MALMKKALPSVLLALLAAALVSCGESSGPTARYREAAAPDTSPPKGGDPVGALPSQVVPGEVAAYRAAPLGAGMTKDRDAAGSLPSHLAEGRSDQYAPAGRGAAVAPRSGPGIDAVGATSSLRGR